MPTNRNEPTQRRKARPALLSSLRDRAHEADPGSLGHTARPGVQVGTGGRPERDALRRRDGQFEDGSHTVRIAASPQPVSRDNIETIGACVCIAAVLFTALTELPIVWISEALR